MTNVFTIRSGPIQVAAVTIVAVVAWRFGVRPIEARAMELRAQADAAEQTIAAAKNAGEDIAPNAEVVRDVKAADARFVALTALGQRQSRLHEEVTKVVQECGGRLASVEPRGKGAAPVTNGAMKVSSVAWTVEASGSFESLTRVLDVLEDRIPLSRVQSFRLVGGGPTPGAPEAVLTFDLTNYVIAPTASETRNATNGSGGAAKNLSTLESKR